MGINPPVLCRSLVVHMQNSSHALVKFVQKLNQYKYIFKICFIKHFGEIGLDRELNLRRLWFGVYCLVQGLQHVARRTGN